MKRIGTIIMIAGLLLILIPLVARYRVNQQQQELMENFYLEQEANEETEGAYNALDEVFAAQAREYEPNQIAEDNENDSSGLTIAGEDAVDASGQETIGQSQTIGERPKTLGVIRIGAIDLKAPIAEGSSLDVLRYAIGHMKGSTAIGKVGNAIIAGHRSHSFGVYFNRLDELVIGDTIDVDLPSGTVSYEVYESKIVEPDDLTVLRNSSKYKVLTLITCDPVYNPTHRLIVHAIEKK